MKPSTTRTFSKSSGSEWTKLTAPARSIIGVQRERDVRKLFGANHFDGAGDWIGIDGQSRIELGLVRIVGRR